MEADGNLELTAEESMLASNSPKRSRVEAEEPVVVLQTGGSHRVEMSREEREKYLLDEFNVSFTTGAKLELDQNAFYRTEWASKHCLAPYFIKLTEAGGKKKKFGAHFRFLCLLCYVDNKGEFKKAAVMCGASTNNLRGHLKTHHAEMNNSEHIKLLIKSAESVEEKKKAALEAAKDGCANPQAPITAFFKPKSKAKLMTKELALDKFLAYMAQSGLPW
jgi:hypothetical protein